LEIHDPEEFKELPLENMAEVSKEKGYFEKNPKVARIVKISTYILIHLVVVGYFSYATYHYHDISEYAPELSSLQKIILIHLQPIMSATGKIIHCVVLTSALVMECSCSYWVSPTLVCFTITSSSPWWGENYTEAS